MKREVGVEKEDEKTNAVVDRKSEKDGSFHRRESVLKVRILIRDKHCASEMFNLFRSMIESFKR